MKRLLKIMIVAPIFTLAVMLMILCGVISDLWSSGSAREQRR